MELFLCFIFFINLFKLSQEIVPVWDIDSSAINLLSGTKTEEKYAVVDKNLYSVHAYLEKTITKNDTGIFHSNTLKMDSGEAIPVDFENIESFYKINNNVYIVCPKDKHQLYDATNKQYFEPKDFVEKGNWDLKCYKHNTGYFLVFYFMNGEKQYFYAKLSESTDKDKYRNKHFTSQLFDFKLTNGDSNKYDNGNWYKYKMGALVLESNYIKLKSLDAEFHNYEMNDDLSYIMESSATTKSINLIESKTHSSAYFNDSSDEFYFMTYNNASDFTSGYSSKTTNDYYNIQEVEVHINQESPFDFVDKVEIREMKFLLYNKYIYYSIYNTQTTKTYHGIYDVKLNKIMFNTDIDIDTFIPYSSNSMLAITRNTAYRICPIKDGDNCIEECTTGQVIRDTDGNKCGTDCGDANKYLLIPDYICLTECDTSIYISNDTKHCGLCKNMDSSKPYRLIGTSECLSQIPEGAYEYNSKSSLLKCKSGYIDIAIINYQIIFIYIKIFLVFFY